MGEGKLIPYLNQARKEFYPKSKVNFIGYDTLNHEFITDCVRRHTEEEILGKRFGFIQRLVENDKIDFEKKLNTIRFNSLVDQTLDSYLALIMILSISDTPIEDLISYLK